MNIYRTLWLEKDRLARTKIAEVCGLKKSGGVEVVDSRVMCDGYTDKDLEGITVEKLKEYTSFESDDLYMLFEASCNKAMSEDSPIDLTYLAQVPNQPSDVKEVEPVVETVEDAPELIPVEDMADIVVPESVETVDNIDITETVIETPVSGVVGKSNKKTK